MSDKPIDDMKHESADSGKDPKTRTILAVLLALWLVTLAALVGVGWSAYFDEKNTSQTLAQQIAFACENGDFGPGFSDEDQAALCSNADKVIEDQGEIQDDEVQEEEIQEPEIQNPEIQNPEIPDLELQDAEKQEPETQNPETQDAEVQEAEEQNPETQDEETQDPEAQEQESQEPEVQEDEKQDEEIQEPEVQNEEIQDEEVQDPEVDDPDPASPYTFTFQFTIPATVTRPAQTYTVTCNSGTGACSVTAT
jgi:hypothetical protein